MDWRDLKQPSVVNQIGTSRIQIFRMLVFLFAIFFVAPASFGFGIPKPQENETASSKSSDVNEDLTDESKDDSTSDSKSESTLAKIEDAESFDDEKSTEVEKATDPDLETSLKEVLEGHSIHGSAFNEGPRQKAYLMGGTGNVNFEVTTESKEAQAFINQGVGQLHGFWYLEAERSFRQAAALDEDCAMAYWGAAMAAYDKRERSQGFIEKAVELKENVTDREKMYIDSLEKYFSDKEKSKTKRAQNYLKDLESIVIKYPDDIEAKAFVAHRVWHNAREGTPVSSYLALNSLIQEILDAEPLHPAHHYTIHLWDLRHPENAIRAAARCGVAAPSIAHMWHMPGHIYSRLKRYEDAVFQQEASARVDHAHMMRDRVMPDEINNFAHNNEWLIRNMIFIGRAKDSISLAKNMIELPQHPKYNTLEKKRGSASYGRRRLLQTLREFQFYEEAIQLCKSQYLETSDETEQIKTLRLLGCSAAIVGGDEIVTEAKATLSKSLAGAIADKKESDLRVAELTAALDKSTDRPPRPKGKKVDAKKGKLHLKEAKEKSRKLKIRIGVLKKSQLAIEGYESVAAGEYETAFKQLEKATGEDVSWLGELQFLSGDNTKGLEKIADQVKRRPKEVLPLARLAYLQHQNGDMDLPEETFNKLRETSGSMDLELEVFSRLEGLAIDLGHDADWRIKKQPSSDLGFRPALDSLGPFRWSPSPAPEWMLKDSDEISIGSEDYLGQPHIVIFYLGHGCLHCAEQLQAFKPKVGGFEAAGIKMLAISTDDHEGLLKSISDAGDEMPIRLASDVNQEVFKKFRAFDDFEGQPLHGTFLIDSAGKIRWQDISYEPFMDHEFLLKESQRLLADDGIVKAQANGGATKKQVSQK